LLYRITTVIGASVFFKGYCSRDQRRLSFKPNEQSFEYVIKMERHFIFKKEKTSSTM
jgi:hypothetical protein